MSCKSLAEGGLCSKPAPRGLWKTRDLWTFPHGPCFRAARAQVKFSIVLRSSEGPSRSSHLPEGGPRLPEPHDVPESM